MQNKGTILIVDDEVKITEVVRAYLHKNGYETLVAFDGKTALELWRNKEIVLIILDLMLPDITGEEICQKIRLESDIPIIMLTAKTEEKSMINGLKNGADDYIAKPFSPRNIVARVEAVLRRTKREGDILQKEQDEEDTILHIDFEQRLIQRNGELVHLTPTEYKIFQTLVQAPNRIFSREQLITFALEDEFDGYDRSIDTYIKSLRKKIEPNRKKPRYIQTVHGVGYKYVP